MLEEINLKPIEKVLDNAQTMMNKIQDSSFSWPERDSFKADLYSTSTLLAEMQQAFSELVAQVSEHSEEVYGQGMESEIGEAIHKAYNLLSHLYNDLHVIENAESTGNDALERASIHFKQITNHYGLTRDLLQTMTIKHDVDWKL